MNKVILIGRLTAAPELRYTTNNVPVANYRLAVDRPPQDGQTKTDFFDCVTWRNNAEFASRFLNKGTKIAIEGKRQNREYTDKNGAKRTKTEIVVEHHEFCESKSKAPAPAASDEAPGNDFGYGAAPDGYSDLTDADGKLPFLGG